MTPIAHKPQGSEQHQNQSFYLHRWIETIISRSKAQISSLVLKFVVGGGSIHWRDRWDLFDTDYTQGIYPENTILNRL